MIDRQLGRSGYTIRRAEEDTLAVTISTASMFVTLVMSMPEARQFMNDLENELVKSNGD